ncbi:MAG: zinc ABC transporter substrate-binding protein [Cytophagales bacterium]|nr:zinc ABC transporter substrate-binding protein [Cytophagales bacterium]
MCLLFRFPCIYFFCLILCLSCQGPSRERANVDKLRVVCTTGIIYDAVLNVAGDLVNSRSLMGPGVDPHLYKASHADLEELEGADLIFYTGLHLEGKMGDILASQSRLRPVIAVGEALPRDRLISVGKDLYDPHVWFDVSLWQEVVREISAQLQNHDGRNREFYVENTRNYLRELSDLHAWVQLQLDSIPATQRLLLTAHDAFGYLGRSYGLELRGIQGISTQSDFGLSDITSLVDEILDRRVRAIFMETSVSDRPARAIISGCAERGYVLRMGAHLYSDAMGSAGTPEGTYIGMFRFNVRSIVTGLRGS